MPKLIGYLWFPDTAMDKTIVFTQSSRVWGRVLCEGVSRLPGTGGKVTTFFTQAVVAALSGDLTSNNFCDRMAAVIQQV